MGGIALDVDGPRLGCPDAAHEDLFEQPHVLLIRIVNSLSLGSAREDAPQSQHQGFLPGGQTTGCNHDVCLFSYEIIVKSAHCPCVACTLVTVAWPPEFRRSLLLLVLSAACTTTATS